MFKNTMSFMLISKLHKYDWLSEFMHHDASPDSNHVCWLICGACNLVLLMSKQEKQANLFTYSYSSFILLATSPVHEVLAISSPTCHPAHS